MTNVSTPTKVATRRGLFRLGEEALKAKGWTIGRVPRGGKSSLREIIKGNEKKRVSIRTSQDTWIAFPFRTDAKGKKSWVTLGEVDFVVAVSVNDRIDPTEARVHMIPADDARARFDRAYAARDAANHTQPEGRGIWLSLYDPETPGGPVAHVGGGMGIDYEPIKVHDLTKGPLVGEEEVPTETRAPAPSASALTHGAEAPLTITEAKRRLALTLGVPESAIRIAVEH